MKPFTVFLLLAMLIIGCGSANNSISLLRVLRMNQNEFQEIQKISIEDANGFKFIKTTLDKNKFSSTSTTTENQTITNEEHKAIKAILKKY